MILAVSTLGNEPHFAKWLDLQMLLLPGGHERAEADLAKLFEQRGSRLTPVVHTKSPVCVLEAEKPNRELPAWETAWASNLVHIGAGLETRGNADCQA